MLVTIKYIRMQVSMDYKLICGDSVEVMKSLDSESVDVCVTSPPYNLDISYSKYDDNKPYDTYIDWIEDVFVELKRILKPDGHLFLNMAGSSTQPWIAMDAAQRLRQHYVLQNNICWVKSIEKDAEITGHNKPVPGKRFLPRTWENIFHFTKEGKSELDHEKSGVLYKEEWREINKKRTGRDWRQTVNTWFIPYETIGCYGGKNKDKIRGSHPAVFPKKLVDKCCKLMGAEGTLIDPFVGSGTSIIAGLENGMNCIGIDIDENYLKFADERIKLEYNY